MSDPIAIGQILNNSCFKNILEKNTQLKNLTQNFRSILNSDLSNHCYITEISEDSLNLLVDGANWATILRYSIPDIISNLNNDALFANIKKIQYKVGKM